MLGIQLIFISLAVYASGQGVSYYGTSNIRNQGRARLPPRRPPTSYWPESSAPRPVYQPPQPVYQPPQPVNQPAQPVYQPPQPTVATEAPTTKQPVLPPIAPVRPLYPIPLAPRRPAPPSLAPITQPLTAAPVSDITEASTPQLVNVVYPDPTPLPALPAPVDEPAENVTPDADLKPLVVSPTNPLPDQPLPTTSQPIDIEISTTETPPPNPPPIPLEPRPQPPSLPDIRPQPIPVPKPDNDPGLYIPNPQLNDIEISTTETPPPNPPPIPLEPRPQPPSLPDIRPQPIPVPKPDNDPGLYIPNPTTVRPTEPQETRPTPVPSPAPIAPLDPVFNQLIQPIMPPAPLPPQQEFSTQPPLVTYPQPPNYPSKPVRPVNPPSAQPIGPIGPIMQPMGVLPITPLEEFQCTRGNAYYTVLNNCDMYIECQNDKAYNRICPDGLHFNSHAVYPGYPCAYPSEVTCNSDAPGQKPQPTNECPRRYGFFPLSGGDCSKYLTCQDGRATVMNCPLGLVFNDRLSSCDWPGNVPQCNLQAFKDFTCPIPPVDDDADLIYKYRYGSDCKMYVACQHGHPRLLKCDSGMSFDENSQVCIDSELVRNCAAP